MSALESGEIHLARTTIREVLPVKVEEPSGLNISRSPLMIAARRNGSVAEYLALINCPLQGQKLYRFLRRVANDKHDPGIFDVVYDWKMPDRAAVRPKGHEAVHLMPIHQALKESWEMFMPHRKRFAESVNFNSDAFVPDELESPFMTRLQAEQLIKTLLRFPSVHNFEIVLQATQDFIESQLRELIAVSRNSHKLRRSEKRMTATDLRWRLLYRLSNSSHYAKKFFQTDLWNQLVTVALDRDFQQYEFEIEEGEVIPVFRRRGNGKQNVDVPLGKTLRKPLLHRGEIVYTLAHKQGGLVYRRADSQDTIMVPALHWTAEEVTDEQGTRIVRRTLQTSELTDSSLMEAVAVEFPRSLKISTQANALLGMLAVAYLSPDQRAMWPAKMGAPGGTYEQFMGPGQMPVMVGIRRFDLENLSPVLPALEKAVRT